MKGGLKKIGSYGFTIIEVLIVLAVTGFILLSAISYLGGQQDNTEFSQSINAEVDNIQTAINDVASGFFPSQSDFTCIASSGGITITEYASTEQGQNVGCIFLGKALQFGIGGANGTNQSSNLFTIVGAQCQLGAECSDGTNLYSSSINTALPTVLASNDGKIDATQFQTLQYGITVSDAPTGNAGMYINNNPASQVRVVAFTQSLASYDSSSNLISGSQAVDLYAVSSGADDAQTEASGIGSINNSTNWVIPNSVEICFSSSTNKESGLVTIGYNDSTNNQYQLAPTLKLFNTTTCN